MLCYMIPLVIFQTANGEGYRVKNCQTGKYYSKRGLTRETCVKQKYAIERDWVENKRWRTYQ